MTKPDLGLPSAIQDSTYQQNRDLGNIAFMSKGELMRTIQLMHLEQRKLREKADKYLDESLYFKGRCIELNEEIERLTIKDSNINYLRKAV